MHHKILQSLDAVRLTVEVLEKFSQRKCDDNKKD